MPNTQLDNRIESIEKNLAILEDGFTKLRMDNDNIHSKLFSIESPLQIITHGKTAIEDAEVSTQTTMGKDTSAIESARCVTFITISDDNSFLKKLHIHSCNRSDLAVWLALAK